MGRAVYAKLITSVEDLKRAIIESYGFRLVYFGT
ncbi:BnaC02g36450D [Brassica napus]|uniref:(rape) hypothetical protein n=1 Tax=Brassica napus TaxID=3708 RepID=A0A078GPR3_BRANA|nr:unnamed protein product [Brassica napus]CDY28515.1 BnaC02g36450D [Brassica napus]